MSKYRGGDIADYLTRVEGAAPEAARRAGAEITDAWNDRNFWFSATAEPLTRCAARSPGGMPRGGLAVIDDLQRHFGTWIHSVPAWEPPRNGAR